MAAKNPPSRGAKALERGYEPRPTLISELIWETRAEVLRERISRLRGLYVHHDEPPELATDGPRLIGACASRWVDLTPLHRWLVDNLDSPPWLG